MYDSFYFSKCLNFKIFDVRFPRAAGLHFIPKNLRTDPTKKKKKRNPLSKFLNIPRYPKCEKIDKERFVSKMLGMSGRYSQTVKNISFHGDVLCDNMVVGSTYSMLFFITVCIYMSQ